MEEVLSIAIGDIHGCYDELMQLMGHIQGNVTKPYRFIFLGDYIDRGPDSKKVIQYLMDLNNDIEDSDEKLKHIFLMGNHEDNLLQCIKNGNSHNYIFNNSIGGEATLKSYGVAQPANLPDDHLEWMKNLSIFHVEKTIDKEKRIFVHAGVDRNQPLEDQNPVMMLWIRHEFLHDNRVIPGYVVHGHTPAGRVELKENRCNLDTGCVFKQHSLVMTNEKIGVLSSAVFNDKQVKPIMLINSVGEIKRFEDVRSD